MTDADAARILEDAFARHHRELLSALALLLGSAHDAQDALQDAFVKCWTHRDQVPRINNLRAWLFRVTLNTGRDLRSSAWNRRRRGNPSVNEEGATLIETVASPAASPADDLAEREQLDRLRQAVAQLRPEEQEVFLLRQNAELSYEEIAQELRAPLGTVKTRMRMALAHLRAALGEC